VGLVQGAALRSRPFWYSHGFGKRRFEDLALFHGQFKNLPHLPDIFAIPLRLNAAEVVTDA
jgi:hypothetical protein